MKKQIVALLFTALFLIPTAAVSQPLVRTSGMTANQSAFDGMVELLKLVRLATVNTAALEQSLEQHDFHAEGPDSQGVPLDGEAISFVDKVTRHGGFLVFRDDNRTHTILSSQILDDLGTKQFLSPHALLKSTAQNALRELLHAMVFRSRCFAGSAKQTDDLVGTHLVNDIAKKVSAYLALVSGNPATAHNIHEELVSDIAAKLKIDRHWAACYALLGLPGAFPRPFLTFMEGNPGIPGDGSFVDMSEGQLPAEFELLIPFSLAQAINGITLSAFASPGVDISVIQFSIENVSLPHSDPCRVKLISNPGIPQSFLFKDIEGSFVNAPQNLLEDIVDFANELRPGCNITLGDLPVVTLQLFTGPLSLPAPIEALDAATISLGLDALP